MNVRVALPTTRRSAERKRISMPNRPSRPAHRATVTRVEQLTPHMIRVVVGGEGLRAITAGEFTDHYVKVLFPRPGVTYPEPFDQAGGRVAVGAHLRRSQVGPRRSRDVARLRGARRRGHRRAVGGAGQAR